MGEQRGEEGMKFQLSSEETRYAPDMQKSLCVLGAKDRENCDWGRPLATCSPRFLSQYCG